MTSPVLPGEGPMTDTELADLRQGFSGPYDGHVIRLLDEVQRLNAELAAAANTIAAPAVQLAEIGAMVGYPDPARIADAVRAERDRYLGINESLKRQQDQSSALLFDAGVESVPLSAGVEELTKARDAARSECAALAAKVEAAEVENARLLRVINEITADNAGLTACLDAVHRVAEQPDRDWKRLSERMPQYFKPVDAEERARRTGWSQGVALFRDQLRAAMETPGMPHAPAQEPGSGPETAGTGSDRGTGVAEPHARPEGHWLKFNTIARTITGCQCGFAADEDSDCGFGDSVVAHLLEVGAEHSKAVHLREAAASLRAIADHMPGKHPEFVRGVRYAATLLAHTSDDLGAGDG